MISTLVITVSVISVILGVLICVFKDLEEVPCDKCDQENECRGCAHEGFDDMYIGVGGLMGTCTKTIC